MAGERASWPGGTVRRPTIDRAVDILLRTIPLTGPVTLIYTLATGADFMAAMSAGISVGLASFFFVFPLYMSPVDWDTQGPWRPLICAGIGAVVLALLGPIGVGHLARIVSPFVCPL